MRDVQAVRGSLGGTVNDVALAAIATGFRRILLARGERLDERRVRALVPVSVRTPGSRPDDNQVSAVLVELPVHLACTAEQLEFLRVHTERAKHGGEVLAGQIAAAISEIPPAMFLDHATRLAVKLGQSAVQTIVSNVPGPKTPIYLLGRRAVEISPYIPVGMGLRICIAVFSYNGVLSFSVTGDGDTAPDIDVLCDGIGAGMAALLQAAGGRGSRSG
jgi:diacylglycerol O-acyltransferase